MPVQKCTKNGKSGWRWGKSGKCYTGPGAKAKAAKQGAAAHAAGYSSNKAGKGNSMKLQTITANFTGVVRNDTMGGRDYLVVPMIMLVEGVHEGSEGPLYYPREELSKTPAVWNSKPTVVYHPSSNGGNISACSPDIISSRGIGVIMNTVFEDDKLKAEAWLEVNRIKKVDERILTAIENKETLELSTGLFTDNETMEGDFEGEHYTAIARNYRPDHLAILPDLKGACSIEDGAGFLRLNAAKDGVVLDVTTLNDKERKFVLADENGIVGKISCHLAEAISNEMSHGNIRSLLQSLLRNVDEYLWIEDVYDDFFIYEKDGKLYRQDYVESKGEVSFDGIPEEVIRVAEYRTKDGNFVGNIERKLNMKQKAKDKKEQLVNGLIASESTKWMDDDKDFLMKQEIETLGKMIPTGNQEDDEGGASEETKAAETKAAETKAAETKAAETKADDKGGEQNKAKTVDQYIDDAPEGLQDVLRNGVNSYNADKKRLITFITANKNNTFTEAQLDKKDLEELRSLARLASGDEEQQPDSEVLLNFGGQAEVAENAEAEEPLVAPAVVNIEVKKDKAA